MVRHIQFVVSHSKTADCVSKSELMIRNGILLPITSFDDAELIIMFSVPSFSKRSLTSPFDATLMSRKTPSSDIDADFVR